MEENVPQDPQLNELQNSLETAPSSSPNKTVKIVLIVFSILFFTILAILGWYMYSNQNNSEEQSIEPIPIANTSPPPSPRVSEEPTPFVLPPNAEMFESQNLGVRFFYPQSLNETQQINVVESGSKIYVYPSNMEPEDGQWVEVLSKEPQETLEEAITRLFLSGKDPQQCFVTVTDTDPTDTRTTAIIDFPQQEGETMEDMFSKTQYCSEQYAKTNGIRYFLYDNRYSSTFLYFDIGQYGIGVENGPFWQETIEIVRMRE